MQARGADARQACEVLYRRHFNRIAASLSRWAVCLVPKQAGKKLAPVASDDPQTWDPTAAAAVQDAFSELLKRPEGFDPRNNAKVVSWLHGTARNTLREEWRARAKPWGRNSEDSSTKKKKTWSQAVVKSLGDLEHDPQAALPTAWSDVDDRAAQDWATEARAVVSQLPKPQLEALQLHLCEGLTFQEAAQRAGVAPSTMYARFKAGIRALQHGEWECSLESRGVWLDAVRSVLPTISHERDVESDEEPIQARIDRMFGRRYAKWLPRCGRCGRPVQFASEVRCEDCFAEDASLYRGEHVAKYHRPTRTSTEPWLKRFRPEKENEKGERELVALSLLALCLFPLLGGIRQVQGLGKANECV